MTYLTLRRPAGNLFRFTVRFLATHRQGPMRKHLTRIPSVDVSETENGFEVRAELPGVTKDDLHVSVKDNLLTPQRRKTPRGRERCAELPPH